MKYYEINEATARTAKEMNSFSDYSKGSATNSYTKAVNYVYEVGAEAKQRAKEEKHEYIDYLCDRYAKKYAEWVNKQNRIDCFCPSIMISGGGNFPVRRKEKQNSMRDRHMAEYAKIKSIIEKLEDIGTGKEIIKSSDENAIEMLQDKLDGLVALQEEMKRANAHWRKYGTMADFEDYTEEEAVRLDEAINSDYSRGGQPHASFMLTNNNAKIKNTRERLENLQKIKARPTEEKTEKYQTTACKVVEDTQDMRIRLFFEGKPSDEVRSILKSNGFRWAPSQSAWQRQLTNNAIYSTKRALEQIEALTQAG